MQTTAIHCKQMQNIACIHLLISYIVTWQYITLLFLWYSQPMFLLLKNRSPWNFVLSKNFLHTSIFQPRQSQPNFLNNIFMKNETLFTIKEVVDKKLLGYKERTIRQLIKDGKLWFVDISEKGSIRRIIRIPESAIGNFVKERTQ